MKKQLSAAAAILSVLTVACPAAARASGAIPYSEHVQLGSTRLLTFSVPSTGYRVIKNISCIVQLISKQPQTPALAVGVYGLPDYQVIYTPMTEAGPNVFINTTPILAYVHTYDSVTFEAGLSTDVPVNLGCTLTGESFP